MIEIQQECIEQQRLQPDRGACPGGYFLNGLQPFGQEITLLFYMQYSSAGILIQHNIVQPYDLRHI